ncbi:hypothetical protein GCM10027200_46440 [Lentzea nigeriaca]
MTRRNRDPCGDPYTGMRHALHTSYRARVSDTMQNYRSVAVTKSSRKDNDRSAWHGFRAIASTANEAEETP